MANKFSYSINNGITFIPIPSIFSSWVTKVKYDGSGLWVGCGWTGTNTLAYSLNGTQWVGLGSSIFATGKGIEYNGTNLWVAIGFSSGINNNNCIAYSSNGTNSGVYCEPLNTAFNPVVKIVEPKPIQVEPLVE